MACLRGADILLPADRIDKKKWAVIACDQFTSQPEYWEQVKQCVGDVPSTFHIIYPEAYLLAEDEEAYTRRLAGIQSNMRRYLAEGVLTERVHEGYVLTVRETEAGVRAGLIAALDLEAYDYTENSAKPVRATEETVQERIPVRVGIREHALIESPHIMMLLDDADGRLLEPLYQKKEELRRLYDTELMFGGGKVCGYAVEGREAEALTKGIEKLERKNPEIFLAVGDGNHSLAAAKTCWENLKEGLPAEEAKKHPGRYALVEVVNLHCPALQFEAIHRVLYGGRLDTIVSRFEIYLKNLRNCGVEKCSDEGEADIIFIQRGCRIGMKLSDTGGHLAVELLQHFLDKYIEGHAGLELDYVHSPEAVEELSKEENVCGMLLRPIDKSSLFPAICAGGVLPRKTFSMGMESQKRYYMECRRLDVHHSITPCREL